MIFVPCDLEISRMTLNKANLRDLIAATGLVILLKLDSNHQFFSQCDLEIWWMTSKSNSTPLICYVKLFASFQIHRWIQMELQSSNAEFGSKSAIFLSRVTFKFDGWPWKTICHLFYTTPSFVHHFKAMGEFKLELQFGHAQLGSKWAIFLSRVTLKVDGWPRKTIGHLFYMMSMSSFVHHMRTIGEFKLELQSGNAQFGSKLATFCPLWPWNLTDDLKLEHLERLHSEIPPTATWSLIPSHQIPSQNKTGQSQSYKFKKLPKIQILQETLHATHLQKLLD